MSDPVPQSYANHRAVPKLYLFVGLILAIDVIVRIWNLIQDPRLGSAWALLVGVALVAWWMNTRSNALRLQDRIILQEMHLRFQRIPGLEKSESTARLDRRQLIALRFASDAELPALIQTVLAENITKPDEIKKRIKDWQPDLRRV